MTGVLVNVIAIVVGSSIGLIFKAGLKEKYKVIMMQGIGLSIIIIGVAGAIESNNLLLLVFSLVIGGMIGTFLGIENNLEKLGRSIEQKFASKEGGFAKGFVMATLIYCVGAMAIVGSIEAGVSGDNQTLYIKSVLDGVTAIIFTATLGYGVMFSAVSVLLYQGTIVILGKQAAQYLTESLTNEISAVGSVIILGIGLTLLEIKKIRVGDLLPSVLIPIVWFALRSLF
jgi:uncharacterized membrane protein YqgA involved in biofilm formation